MKTSQTPLNSPQPDTSDIQASLDYQKARTRELYNQVHAPNKAQHSPFPWELDATDWPLIVNESGDCCVALIESKEYNGRDYSCQSETALANAKLIVRAVNTHAEALLMAEALRKIQTECNELHPIHQIATFALTTWERANQ